MKNTELRLHDILYKEVRDARSLRGLVGISIILSLSILLSWILPQIWIWGTALVIILSFWLSNRTWKPSLLSLCRSLERKNPEIRDLVTSILQLEKTSEGMNEVIRYRLWKDLKEAQSRPTWNPLVSSDQIVLLRVLNIVFVIGLLLPMWGGILGAFNGKTTSLSGSQFKVEITPENAEVEKGSTVPIIARFDSSAVPQKVWMLSTDANGNTNKLELIRNLNDPFFGTAVTKIEDDVVYRIQYDSSEVGPFKLSVFEFPFLVRADATITYPTYFGKEADFIEDTLSITGNEGAELSYKFYFNVPVKSAQLLPVTNSKSTSESSEPIELAVHDSSPKSATWNIQLSENARYKILLTDQEGRNNKILSYVSIKVIKNKIPDFKWTRPGRDIEVSPLEELQLAGKVTDDFGLLGHGLVMEWSGADSNEIEFSKPNQNDPDNEEKELYQEGDIDHLISFEENDSQSGDIVSVAAWADDFDVDGSRRRSYSDIYFVSVKSLEQILRQGQNQNQNQNQSQNQNQQQGQQGGQGADLIENQKLLISATWNTFKRGKTIRYRDSVETLTESQMELISALEAAAQELTPSEEVSTLVNESKALMDKSLDILSQSLESEDLKDLRSAIPVQTQTLQKLVKLFNEDESNVSRTHNRQQGQQGQSNRSQRMLDQLEFNQNESNYQTQSQAESNQTEEQQARTQVLDKLRDLAQRQLDINERIQELDAALRAAESKEEKEKIRRELKKLQEEQRELMQELDDARQNVTESSAREMEETLQQMDQTRQAMENTQQAMQDNQLTQARNEGARAEQSIDQLRQDFRERSSSQFTEQIRELSQKTRELQKNQNEISDQIRESATEDSKNLSGSDQEQELVDKLQGNTENLDEILDAMRQISEQSEDVEPLLSKALYDTLRQVSQDQLSETLDSTREMVERGFIPMAEQFREQSEEGMENLIEGVQEAVEKVLGDEAAALEQAANRLRNLREEVENEVRSLAQNQNNQNPNDSQPSRNQNDQNPSAEGSSENPRQSQESTPGRSGGQEDNNQENQQSNQPSQGNNPGGENPGQGPGQNEQQSPDNQNSGGGQNPGERPNPGNGQNPGGNRNPQDGQSPGGGQSPQDQEVPFFMERDGFANDGGGGSSAQGPLTGQRFQQWSRGLEEVEDMVFDESLRDRAAQINDRAREIRQEFRRSGKDPQWDLVNMEILDPILQLEAMVDEALALKRQKNNELVPVDRDPVPAEFSKFVDQYYKRLSEMRQSEKQ